jgi:hypothetical protein
VLLLVVGCAHLRLIRNRNTIVWQVLSRRIVLLWLLLRTTPGCRVLRGLVAVESGVILWLWLLLLSELLLLLLLVMSELLLLLLLLVRIELLLLLLLVMIELLLLVTIELLLLLRLVIVLRIRVAVIVLGHLSLIPSCGRLLVRRMDQLSVHSSWSNVEDRLFWMLVVRTLVRGRTRSLAVHNGGWSIGVGDRVLRMLVTLVRRWKRTFDLVIIIPFQESLESLFRSFVNRNPLQHIYIHTRDGPQSFPEQSQQNVSFSIPKVETLSEFSKGRGRVIAAQLLLLALKERVAQLVFGRSERVGHAHEILDGLLCGGYKKDAWRTLGLFG